MEELDLKVLGWVRGVLEFDLLMVREKRFADDSRFCFCRHCICIPCIYLFIYFVKIILEATSHFSIKSTSSV